jgi:ribonuclease HI
MKKLDIWTDGSARPNPGYGGWGIVFRCGDIVKEHSGSAPDTTNNRMEMTAALEALKALRAPCVVNLRSDSKYLIDAFTKKWVVKWMKNGWKTAEDKPVKNQDIWELLWAAAQPHQITWTWVKGHADEEGNIRCDALANEARLQLEAATKK